MKISEACVKIRFILWFDHDKRWPELKKSYAVYGRAALSEKYRPKYYFIAFALENFDVHDTFFSSQPIINKVAANIAKGDRDRYATVSKFWKKKADFKTSSIFKRT